MADSSITLSTAAVAIQDIRALVQELSSHRTSRGASAETFESGTDNPAFVKPLEKNVSITSTAPQIAPATQAALIEAGQSVDDPQKSA